MDPRAAALLQGVLQAKRQSLRFLWKNRRFLLCADFTFRRYNGDEFRHSAAITSGTSVAKVGSTEFTVTFLQPDLHYHIRAGSSAERDRWVVALADAIRKQSEAASPGAPPPRPPPASPAAPPPTPAPAINFATQWVCERGLVWPKAVDYMTQCPKGHTLTACACLPRCHVCGDDAQDDGGMSCTQGCTSGVCATCLTTLKQRPAPAAGGGGGDFPSLGVSAEFLQAFQTKWGQRIRGWSTEQVCQQLIKTLTCRSRGSVCDDLAAAGSAQVGEANIFLSHTWGNLFLDTVDAALGAVQAAGAFIWFDVFSTSQHSAIDKPSSWWMSTFRDAIAKMGSLAMVLQPWDDPLALKRAW